MRVVLEVGHSQVRQGAITQPIRDVDPTTEWEFNTSLVEQIKDQLRGMDVRVTGRDLPDDYAGLHRKINGLSPTFAVSLHCNAFNHQASGSEVLYWHTSSTSKRLAMVLQHKIVETLDLPDRGIKPLESNDRGGSLLRKTACPHVICEPFFIDNPGDFVRAVSRFEDLAVAYAEAIREYADMMTHA